MKQAEKRERRFESAQQLYKQLADAKEGNSSKATAEPHIQYSYAPPAPSKG